MSAPAWKYDLATQALQYAPDGSTFAAVTNVDRVTLSIDADILAGGSINSLVAVIHDTAEETVVLNQSSALGGSLQAIGGGRVTHERRSSKGDTIILLDNGTTVLTLPAGGFPAAGVFSVLSESDTAVKAGV